MARFNSEAYDKLYPRTEDVEVVESAVSTFRPTEKKLEDDKVEETTVEIADNEEVGDGENTDCN